MGSLTRQGAAALLIGIIAAWALDAQQLPAGCNSLLVQRAKQRGVQNGYAVRQAGATRWCEGQYIAEVSDVVLLLEEFVEQQPPIAGSALGALDTLVIEWRAPAGTAIAITARHARHQLTQPYELDVVAQTDSTGKGFWRWPTAVVRACGCWPVATMATDGQTTDAMVSVQARASLGAGDSVYIPVRLVRASGVPWQTPAQFRVSLVASEAVDIGGIQLFKSQGARSDTIRMARGCPAPEGRGAVGELIKVTVCMPANAAGGTYELHVGASVDREPTRGKVIRFYLPPTR